METLKTKIVGIAPILFHNGRLADPLHPLTRRLKEITKRRNKSDADLLEMREAEWRAGMYEDEEGRVVFPSDNVLAGVIEGARYRKNGKQVEIGVYAAEPFFRFDHAGPKTVDELWASGSFFDCRGAGQRNVRVMRTRPIFRKWTVHVALLVDTDVLNMEVVSEALRTCGERIGLGDWRPRFGRFVVEG